MIEMALIKKSMNEMDVFKSQIFNEWALYTLTLSNWNYWNPLKKKYILSWTTSWRKTCRKAENSENGLKEAEVRVLVAVIHYCQYSETVTKLEVKI